MYHPSRPGRRASLLVAATLGLGLAGASAHGDEYQRYRGEARAPDSGARLYDEVHLLHLHDGHTVERLVLYTCPNGAPFARKLVRYGSWPYAPDLRFEDARSGAFNAIDSTGGTRRVAFRDRRTDKEESAPVPADANLVADAGFDEFIRRHWDAMLGHAPVPFDILLPGDGSILHLKARHLRHTTLEGTDVEVFRVTLAGILGLIAPNIDVYYSAQDHVLRRFDGVSNIRDPRGRHVKAVIDFPAEPPEPTDGSVWHGAQLQPLATTCAP